MARKISCIIFLILAALYCKGQVNKDPLQVEIITSDIKNFWMAYDSMKSHPSKFNVIFNA